MPKYYIDNNTSFVAGKNKILHPIVAEETFVNGATGITVEAGELGGYVESTSNLSVLRETSAWIFPDCYVYGDSFICDSAAIMHGASINYFSRVGESAIIDGPIDVRWHSLITGTAYITAQNSVVISKSLISAGSINIYKTNGSTLDTPGVFCYVVMRTRGIKVSGSIMIRGNESQRIEVFENIKGNGEIITDQRQLALFY